MLKDHKNALILSRLNCTGSFEETLLPYLDVIVPGLRLVAGGCLGDGMMSHKSVLDVPIYRMSLGNFPNNEVPIGGVSSNALILLHFDDLVTTYTSLEESPAMKML